MSSIKPKIGIIGAGTSGLYLAYLLLEQGYDVQVFERSPQPRTTGCGIMLVSAGMEALYQGSPELCQQVIDSGAIAKTFEFRNLRDQIANAETVTYSDNERPAVLVHREAILNALLERLPADRLHCGAAFESAVSSANGVTVQFRNGTEWQGDLVVGADGIFSSVREAVVPQVQPVYLGDRVWRGIVQDDSFCTDGRFIVYMRGRGIYANFFDIGNGLTHWGFFQETERENGNVGQRRLGQTPIPPDELAKLPELPQTIIRATDPDQINCRFSYDIDPLPRLYCDRVVLIGDAAHAKSPTRARGMTAGFEDALSLSQHIMASPSVDAALQAFQAERLPIVHEYQLSSRNISRKIGRRQKKKVPA